MTMNILKRIGLISILFGVLISIIEWFYTYITYDVFLRTFIAYIVLYFLYRVITRRRTKYKLFIYVGLIIVNFTFTYIVLGFFYEIDHFIILAPNNYHGDILIRTHYKKSSISITPTNRTVIIKVDSLGYADTKSRLNVPFNTIGIARIKGKKMVSANDDILDVQFLNGNSLEGKFEIIKVTVLKNK